MLSLAVWVITLALEAVLLLRALKGGCLRVYPMFYLYLAGVLIQSSSLLVIYYTTPRYYASCYWYAEFLSVGLGCGAVWEIYRKALGCFPGASRMANNVLGIVLVVAISKVLVSLWNSEAWSLARTTVELERNFRAVQAGLLIGLVIVIMFYRIPLGQNLSGILLGYGLFIGSNVMILATRALLGTAFQTAWHYLQPLTYFVVLCIWCTTLWSHKTAPTQKAEPKIEQDYELLSEATRKGLLQVRAHLARAIRS